MNHSYSECKKAIYKSVRKRELIKEKNEQKARNDTSQRQCAVGQKHVTSLVFSEMQTKTIAQLIK